MEHDPKSKQSEDDAGQAQAISESKMRQALGIEPRSTDRHVNPSHGGGGSGGGGGGGNSGAPRRRFVTDGDVPVVMIGRRRDHASAERPEQAAAQSDRIAAIEAQLATERDARTRAEALLAEARHSIQNLQAKVAHADLARDEALAREQRAMSERNEALRELQEAQNMPAPEPVPAPVPPPEAPPVTVRPRREMPAPAALGCDVPAFTAQILAAYLARNKLSPAELPGLAESVMHALVAAGPQGRS